ncbi:hypothetical protein CDEST_15569 [Colletotrichum destructivum]|uniref:Uncharacterized protein n=1 Tax=Colletotrichum destructivum TaxID=34406 RepID=A0AAX4J562_9PEZI|nr:hypothetical protein CDEST_15569 [Colletotrichum destructivum]
MIRAPWHLLDPVNTSRQIDNDVGSSWDKQELRWLNCLPVSPGQDMAGLSKPAARLKTRSEMAAGKPCLTRRVVPGQPVGCNRQMRAAGFSDPSLAERPESQYKIPFWSRKTSQAVLQMIDVQCMMCERASIGWGPLKPTT